MSLFNRKKKPPDNPGKERRGKGLKAARRRSDFATDKCLKALEDLKGR